MLRLDSVRLVVPQPEVAAYLTFLGLGSGGGGLAQVLVPVRGIVGGLYWAMGGRGQRC